MKNPEETVPAVPLDSNEPELENFSLEVDDEALEERSQDSPLTPASLVDEKVRLLLRENQLGLHRGQLKVFAPHPSNERIIEMPLRCMAQAHPECQFTWVYLAVSFRSNVGVTITDIVPRDAVKEPVKIVTKSTGSMSIESEVVKLGPNFGTEVNWEYQIYYPELTTYGIGTSGAVWQFQALPQAPLFVNSQLRLLASLPSQLVTLSPQFTMRARIAVKGISGYIPVVGYRTIEIEINNSHTVLV